MPTPQPKEKIKKFIEEINKAKTKEELHNILKRLETFAKLHPTEENLYWLAVVYKKLEEYQKALEILESLQSYPAKFLEAVVLEIIDKDEEAYNLFSKLIKFVPNEEEKMKIDINRILILWKYGKLKQIKEIEDKYGDKLYYFADKIGVFNVMAYIKNKMEDYKKGLELVNQDNELRQIQEEIKEIAKKYFKEFEIYPMLVSYYDGGDDDFKFIIVLPEKPDKHKEKEFRYEVIEEVDFKHPEKEFYVSIRYPLDRRAFLVSA